LSIINFIFSHFRCSTTTFIIIWTSSPKNDYIIPIILYCTIRRL